MELLVQLILGLAWPLVVVWTVYQLREELKALISRVSHIKYKNAEAKFEHELSVAEAKSSSVAYPAGNTAKDSKFVSKYDQLWRISAISPRASILEAWILIEEAAKQSGYVQGGACLHTNVPMFIESCISKGSLPAEASELIKQLRILRNQAAHLPDFTVSQDEAERYIKLAIKVAEMISTENK